jgi:serine/threonine protein kinase
MLMSVDHSRRVQLFDAAEYWLLRTYDTGGDMLEDWCPGREGSVDGFAFECNGESARCAHRGRFQVDALLGRGGMATVYRVTEVATQQQLALKQLAIPMDAPGRQDLAGCGKRSVPGSTTA